MRPAVHHLHAWCVDADVALNVQACDAGALNSGGHGCTTDCTKDAGAICEVDEDLLSHCRLCGNGKREEGEVCDDLGSSGGCAGDCLSIAAGWTCTGGSMSTTDVCLAGPAQPAPPLVGVSTETSISWSWSAPQGHGLPISSYVFHYEVTNVNGTTSHEETTVSAEISLSQLPRVPAEVYLARIKACTSAGCSAYSDPGAPASVLPPAAATQLASVAAAINADPVAVMAGGLGNLTLTEIAVAAPEPEPEAPAVAEVLNITAEQMALLLQGNNASITIEGTPPPVQTPEPSGGVTYGAAAAGFSATAVQVAAGEFLDIEVLLSKPGDDNAMFGGSLIPVSMQWETQGFSAQPGVDYVEQGGSLTFSPGTISQTLTITMLASSSTSPKIFTVFLMGFSNAEPHPERSRINVTVIPANTTAAAIVSTSAASAPSTTPVPTSAFAKSTTPTPTAALGNISYTSGESTHTSTASLTTTPIATALTEVVVSIVVGLPITEAAFTNELQLNFRRGLAAAARVGLDKVTITSIKSVSSSRRAADSLQIGVAVSTDNSTAAIGVAEQLTDDQISGSLEANGIAGATVLEPPVLSSLPEACTAVQSECNATYQSCLTTRSACQCLTDFSKCLTGCHTMQLVASMSGQCSLSYCHSTCPLPPSAIMVEQLIDASVDNRVSLSSGEGVFIPRGALASNTKIVVRVLSSVPRVPGHQGLTVRSKAISFSPSGQTFQKAVTLRIYVNGSLPATGRRLAIFKYNTQTLDWNEKLGSKMLATERMVEAETMSFSTYAVFELDEEAPLAAPTPVRESNQAMGPWQIVALVAIVIFCMLLLVMCVLRQTKEEREALARAKLKRDKELLEPAVIAPQADLGIPAHSANIELTDSAPSSNVSGVDRVAPIKISEAPKPATSSYQVMNDDESPPESDDDEHQPRLDLMAAALSSRDKQREQFQPTRPPQTVPEDEHEPRLDLLAAQAAGPSDSVSLLLDRVVELFQGHASEDVSVC